MQARVWQLECDREGWSSQEKCFRSPFRWRIDARSSSRTSERRQTPDMLRIEEMDIVNRLVLAGVVLAGIQVCGVSRAFAQDKAAPPTGMVVKSGANSPDQQMALTHRQIDSMKRQAIAANVTLTDTEATKFWPVYEQYSAELKKITYTKNALIKEYAEEYGSLTDEQADSLIRRWLDSDIATFELRRKYLPIFRKVLPGKVTATFFQVEHRIDAMIDLQLTAQLPLMQNQDESAGVQ